MQAARLLLTVLIRLPTKAIDPEPTINTPHRCSSHLCVG
jgi:hypothetical protein